MGQVEADVVLVGEDIHLNFGGIKALTAVEFQIKEGQIMSIIGPNGAGKTCLINCITGYYCPQKGRILFNGQDILGHSPDKIAKLGISRTFQNPSTYPNMTTLDILMAARYMHSRASILDALIYFGRSRREELANRRIVEQMVNFSHIEDLRKRPIFTMSYGQRKQVEIARALTMQPKIILLDEPMSGLDDVMKEIVSELILNMHKKGMTIILIEHDMQAVMELSHSIIVLDYGQKIAEGTPTEIFQNPLVVEAYLGGASDTTLSSKVDIIESDT
jgi:branched-chain amino acid transport system ATP-binding protein